MEASLSSLENVLVIVLSSGENETEECIKSINMQAGVDFSLYRIIDRPNKEAHEKLYRKIEEETARFDVFVKVDADMIFVSRNTLAGMVDYFRKSEVDHAVFSVLDWYSQTAIMGMHVFSNRCTWPDLNDPLFVDPSPSSPGESILVWDKPSPVAYHSPNPSISQAVQFGFHRGLKITQRKRDNISISRALFHYNLIKQVYNQYMLSRDSRLRAALYGAERAIRSRESVLVSRNDGFIEKIIDEYLRVETEPLDRKFVSRWGVNRYGTNALFQKTFFPIVIRYWLLSLKRKLIGKCL